MNDLFGLDDPLTDGGDASLDLTPIIDVVFLLLIFFIMATTFSMPVLDVVLPTAASAAPAQEEAGLTITIDQEGRILHGETALDRPALATLLNTAQDLPVHLFVDERAPFEPFVMVMDQAKLARRTHVSITTKPLP